MSSTLSRDDCSNNPEEESRNGKGSTSSCNDRTNDSEKESRNKISSLLEVYDEVLEYNKVVDKLYRDQEESLNKKLAEIRAELALYLKEELEKPPREENFRYFNVGRPYFKDKNFQPPPDNLDTVIMKHCGMYDFSNVMSVAGWTVGDKSGLIEILVDLARDFIKRKIDKEISELQRISIKTDACWARIEELKKELFDLKFKEMDDLDLPDDLTFDWQDVALKLNKRHSAGEYKAIWNLFFHPKVNKRSWKAYEHVKLQSIVSERGMQGWEDIAKELGTNRTGYQCFVYYRTNVSHTASGRKWTQSEVNHLENLISLHKEQNYIPWGKVAAAMPNRTKIQCYNKYSRMIEKRKGRFLPEEDAVILNFVTKYGQDFRRMSQFLSGRSAVQLRVRYHLLCKLRVSATWSVEDDRKLLQIMAYQDSSSNFSDATAHFPGKDRQNIRSRYNTLIRWMKSHPHSDVSAAPRRGARRLAHGEPGASLLDALARLKRRMQADLNCPDKKKKKQKVSRTSSESVIHDAIMSTIANLETSHVFADRTFKARVQDTYQEMRVADIASTSKEQLNLFNTKYFLIALNTKIANKTKFYNSDIGRKFKALEQLEPPKMGTVKSYAKSKEVSGIALDVKPDLFGNTAGRRFFLPPNFATLTGSRVILNYQGFFKERSDINLKVLCRRDPCFKIALKILKERFLDIFTWPYILSNQSPENFNVTEEDVNDKRAKPKPAHKALTDADVPILPPPPKRLCLKKKDRGIDMNTTDADIDISPDFNELIT